MSVFLKKAGFHRSSGRRRRGLGTGNGVGGAPYFFLGQKHCIGWGLNTFWSLCCVKRKAKNFFVFNQVHWMRRGFLLDLKALCILGWEGFPARRGESKRFLNYYASFYSFCILLNVYVYTYLHVQILPSQTTFGEAQG